MGVGPAGVGKEGRPKCEEPAGRPSIAEPTGRPSIAEPVRA